MQNKIIYFIIFLSLLFIGSPSLNAQQTDIRDTLQASTQEFQDANPHNEVFVLFQGDSLFVINANLGPYAPKERARAIEERLETIITEEMDIELDSFIISEKNNYSTIVYKDKAILCIGDEDVMGLLLTKEQLANKYLAILRATFEEKAEKQTLIDWLVNIGLTLLTLLGLILLFYLLNKLFGWINNKLIQYEQGLKRKRKSIFKYLIPNNKSNIFLFLSKAVKLAISILILFLYLPLLFGFLPWTKGLVEQFYSYIADPVKHIINGFANFLPNLFFIFIIVAISRYIIRIISFISKEIEDDKLKLKGFHKDWARPTSNIIKIIVFAFALVFMFPYLPGSDSKAFQGVSIFLGVLFSLGSTSAIANIVAGIVITYMRPFTIGDRVKIGETIGDVIEKNLLVTRLITTKNEDITIPNSTIINTHLWNYSKNASTVGIILHPTVTIGYDVPSEQVIQLLLDAAKNTKNLTRDFKPFVLQKSLNDFYVEYELNVYTRQPKKMPHFYSELNKSIHKEFNDAGVEILSPHYSAFRDGNAPTTPIVHSNASNPTETIINKATNKKQ